MPLVVLGLKVLLMLLLSIPPAPTWRQDPRADGMTLEVRDVPGSKFEELRVTTTSDHSLEELCDAIWARGSGKKKPEGNFKKRVVIKETDTERWTYEQIRVPLVTDRDCVMVANLVQPPSSGRCEIHFETRSHPSWPVVRDHVRLPVVRGSWTLVPTAEGKTSVTYVVFSEPGGGVPAIFARGPQRSAALGFLKQILARAGKR